MHKNTPKHEKLQNITSLVQKVPDYIVKYLIKET